MSTPFDPYYAWFGIGPNREPLDHYLLLGLSHFENDIERIQKAANDRLSIAESRITESNALADRMRKEIIVARDCLVDQQAKSEYDKWLAMQHVFSTFPGCLKESRAGLSTITSIESTTEKERIFYLHEFIYFLETSLQQEHAGRVEFLLEYITYLLLVFDRILIPAEHITITANEEALIFKREFFDHFFTRQLIDAGRIITTVWNQCNDLASHLEASRKYLSDVGAASCFDDRIAKSIPGIKTYGRSPTKQSGFAREQLHKLFAHFQSESAIDRLRYEDPPIIIPISTERLHLGDCRELHPYLHRRALEMYVKVMPIGNGRIYRSAISSMEPPGQPFTLFTPEEDSISQFLLSPSNLRKFFCEALKFKRVNETHFDQVRWVSYYLTLLNSMEMCDFRASVVRILNYISLHLSDDLARTRIIQTGIGDAKLVGEGIAAIVELCVGRMARAILFLGNYCAERASRKHFYLKAFVRKRFNEIANCSTPTRPMDRRSAA